MTTTSSETSAMNVTPFQVRYPEKEFAIWKTDIPENQRLEIINQNDFPLAKMLKGMGIHNSPLQKSFGITDPDEIQQRLDLMEFFQKNPDFLEWIKGQHFESSVPVVEDDFLEFYNPSQDHNPFWTKINNLLNWLDNKCEGTIPDRLAKLADYLRESIPLEQSEQEMAIVIKNALESITVIEGVSSFVLIEPKEKGDEISCINLKRINVHGHQKFSSGLTNYKWVSMPKFTFRSGGTFYMKWMRKFIRVLVTLLNSFPRRRAMKNMVIKKSPGGLIDDLRLSVETILKSHNEFPYIGSDSLVGCVFHVFFRYDEKGLKIRFFKVEPGNEIDTFPEEKVSFMYNSFPGHGFLQRIQSSIIKSVAEKSLEETAKSFQLGRLTEKLQSTYENFFSQLYKVESTMTDKEFRWVYLSNLYNTGGIKKAYQAIQSHRVFFGDHLIVVKQVADLFLNQQKAAKEKKATLSRGELLTNGDHMVSFKKAWPSHLFLDKDIHTVIPFSGLITLNGNLVGGTGRHGAGKSTAGITLAGLIYCIQSGLLVFAEEFKCNPKSAIAVVASEIGKGSTAQVLVTKIANVLRGVAKFKNHQVVVMLDELGTGTQQDAGLKLGQDVLKKLHKDGFSVYFSTQILELAHWVEDNLGGKCFKMGKNHTIEPGIANGAMNDLREKSGLNMLLQ